MKNNKNIWILNHYATSMFRDKGGRHYWFAKYLVKKGYKVRIFCASHIHNTSINRINNHNLYKEEELEGVSITYVRTRSYVNNGVGRILNMFDFYKNVQKAAEKYNKPDIIIGSSVHPLACVAAIRLSRKFKCKNIIEIRDLWPESIVAYGLLKRNSMVAKILYKGERWIYEKADHIIMTWPGGYDYIKDKGWEKAIPQKKVTHISNGVDNATFNNNAREYFFEDSDLSNKKTFKISYTGSIRLVNNLRILVDVAETLSKNKDDKVVILVWGEGDEKEKLKKEALNRNLSNIIFKGKVNKQFIPSILSQSDATILHNSSTILDEYGQSQNKFFEYLAAGKPIIMTYSVGHSVIRKKACGIEVREQNAKKIAQAIHELAQAPDGVYLQYCENAKITARSYDYVTLADKLTQVIEKLCKM